MLAVWEMRLLINQRRVALAPAQLASLGVQLLLDRTTDPLLGKTAARWCACKAKKTRGRIIETSYELRSSQLIS